MASDSSTSNSLVSRSRTSLYVVYNNDKTSPISAVAACEIPYHENKRGSQPEEELYAEKCAFTLEYLADCEAIGILAYTETKVGSNVWKLVCKPDTVYDPSNPAALKDLPVHRFDLSMLKKFINMHGAQFTKCPLCKQGSTEKKDVEEHDIDSMAQLQQKCDAQKNSDLQMCFFTEGLMLRKACEERAQNPEEYARVAEQVLKHWKSNSVLESFQTSVHESIELAIQKDHATVMDKVFIHAQSLFDADKQEKLLELACKFQSVDCMKSLIERHKCPIGKYGAAFHAIVKTENVDLIDYMVDVMKKKKEEEDAIYILHDVFRSVVQKDMENVAKIIIENRWHRPSQSDMDLATKLEGAVAVYLESRSAPMMVPCNFDDDDDEEGLTLDDWGDGDGDDGGWDDDEEMAE